MRFVWLLIMCICLDPIAQGQEPSGAPVYARVLFASQLGDVSAITISPNGTVYAADKSRGQIYQLTDRGKDGNLDSQRVIARNLVNPSGLVIISDRLFAADARAIWEVLPRQQRLRRVASLENSAAMITPRPLAASADNTSVIIGLTSSRASTGKLVSVNIETGSAALLASGDGQISSMAIDAKGGMWIGSGSKITPVIGSQYSVNSGTIIASGSEISGLLLPNPKSNKGAVIGQFRDYIFAALTSSGRDRNSTKNTENGLYAIPTQFGIPLEGSAIPLVKSPALARANTTQENSAVLAMDERGIFAAFSGKGAIWKVVKAKPKPKREKPVVIKLDQPKLDIPKAELRPKGSGLTSASTLKRGTTIEVGSTIPEDEDEDTNEEETAPPAQPSTPPKDGD